MLNWSTLQREINFQHVHFVKFIRVCNTYLSERPLNLLCRIHDLRRIIVHVPLKLF